MILSIRPKHLLAAALIAALTPTAHAAGDALWDSRPYRVAVELVAPGFEQATGMPTERLAERVAERLRSRLGAFWQASVAAVAPGQSAAAEAGVDGGGPTPPADEAPSANSQASPAPLFDKTFRVGITRRGDGFHLRVRETDAALGESPVAVEALTPSADALPERLLLSLVEAFRPLVRFQRDPNDFSRVAIAYRASTLAPAPRFASSEPGALLMPYRQELDRNGVSTGPAELVAWTYLMVQPPDAEGQAPTHAEVLSHTRRPFGVRPRGRQELLAIEAIRPNAKPTRLRLHALSEPGTPLPGYEALLGERGSKEQVESLGYTDASGRLTLPPFDGVKQLYLKCGSIVVAALPTASGVAEELVLPLIDERARLRAEVDLTSLREELVDTVARRKILGERIARAIEAERFDEARRLHTELDELPGRTFFLRRLEEIERAADASHPLAEARLKRLFDQTGSVLNAALDPREVRDLAVEIDRARQAAQAAGASATTGLK